MVYNRAQRTLRRYSESENGDRERRGTERIIADFLSTKQVGRPDDHDGGGGLLSIYFPLLVGGRSSMLSPRWLERGESYILRYVWTLKVKRGVCTSPLCFTPPCACASWYSIARENKRYHGTALV